MMIWKEFGRKYLGVSEIQSWNLCEGTEEDHVKPQP
jgi:hypothetical protein